jgi:nucleoside-triphosphatase THEP1
MRALLDSETPVLGTVALKGGGFIAEVRVRSDVTLFEVTTKNRQHLVLEILQALTNQLHR